MECQGFAIEGERAANEAGTRQRIRRSRPRRMSGTVSVFAAALDVGLNSFNVQLDNGRLSFVAQQEFQGLFAVHEAILG